MNSKIMNKKIKHMFPEHSELVNTLKDENPHFSKLFQEHEELDKTITHLELDPINHIHDDIEILKRKKLKIKDELYLLLQKASTLSNK
ncbi:hypothetical protein A7P53_05715 [Acinetobacter defluvii]|uniref:DUF465 domain-containing protein n=1 Tax=Acinetobacter defluvii TaxID=1871111 RepID=A0A2S2FAB0_9GAMM|nr:DUF465 domain-containing protein [Acinetobacter defluvii]AWL27906.1 DUF465 domain-containing protein [Acinetobacter defluvii]NNP71962.1 hypothetical protein [Acinetobacter defluvii]